MGYSKLSGSRLETRFPYFVVAAVAIIFTVQLLLIWNNSQSFPASQPLHEASQLSVSFAAKKEKASFPRKIWQTSRTGPGGFDDGDRDAVRTWTKLNQKWRYESVTQYSAESYIRDRYADEPEIQEIFTDLQDPILRADMIRYLVLLRDGGLYTDLDTKSLKPIDDWVPSEYQGNTSVVVGVEYDRLSGNRWNDWTLDLQFSTWAILTKPNHPLLEHTVQKVIGGLKRLALKQGKTISGVKASREEVLDTTGPALFTHSVFDILSQTTGTTFTWKNVTNLKKPRLVDDILILPVTAFGCGQGHSDSGHPDEETALVQHLFKGSWKGDHMLEEGSHEEHHEDHEEESLKAQERHQDSPPDGHQDESRQESPPSLNGEGTKDLRENAGRDAEKDSAGEEEYQRQRHQESMEAFEQGTGNGSIK